MVAKRRAPKTELTPELGQRICQEIAAGRSLRSISSDKGMPAVSTVFTWMARDPEFKERYARAKDAQIEALAEDILSISDDGLNDTYTDGEGNVRTNQDVVQRSKLRVDSRKWLLAKLAPKKYGERVDMNVTVENTPQEQIDARIAELLRKAGIGAAAGGDDQERGEE